MISCDRHDYIEIACMYRYPVVITLKDGNTISGTAIDTVFNESRDECLKLKVSEEEVLVVLDHMKTLEVSIDNPNFKRVSF